jgi:hypothetical protein
VPAGARARGAGEGLLSGPAREVLADEELEAAVAAAEQQKAERRLALSSRSFHTAVLGPEVRGSRATTPRPNASSFFCDWDSPGVQCLSWSLEAEERACRAGGRGARW